ncbi:hypothetical protein WH5701_12423 [Synechococcus sp. WH 5701]|nr:hypothetical protein WH5701_12423 [Synechococcus sp. WH 5701]
MPSPGCLALHHHHQVYTAFQDFQADLPTLFAQALYLEEAERAIRTLGILEPLTGRHLPPEELLINGSNYRESIVGRGCLSRHRALIMVLQQVYGNQEALGHQAIYLSEALTGFSRILQEWSPQVILSEYLEGVEDSAHDGIRHEDLCRLNFDDRSFNLVITNDVFEHVRSLPMALSEIHRVLSSGGRLICTFPFAYGQTETIRKAIHHPEDGHVELLTDVELHGDPVRPTVGSMVYQIPGWDVLDLARSAGFGRCVIHYISAWKHGVLGGEIPGVFVMEAQRL